MVAAWMFAASSGILIARYFRQTWVGKQLMGKDLWFVVSFSLIVFKFFSFLFCVILKSWQLWLVGAKIQN